MKKNIFWDFDGVILDSLPIKDLGFTKIFENYPKKIVKEFLIYNKINSGLSRFHKIKYFYNHLLKKDIDNKKVLSYAEKFTSIMKKKLSSKKYLIKDSLIYIKSNYKNYNFHLVSASEHNELNYLCKKLNLDKYFLTIDGSPTPKINLIRDLLKKLKYKKKETIYIGDSVNDLEAAKINKIDFYGYNEKKLMSKSTVYIDTFRNISI